MPIPSLIPVPVFRRGYSSLRLVPRPHSGSQFLLKVRDGVAGHAQQFSLGDILRVRVWNGSAITDNWLRVDSLSDPGASAGWYGYGVTRMSGTPGLIPAGTAVVNYGASGASFISLSSDGTIGAAPNITIGNHTGSPWTSTTTLVKLGNLNGDYGIASNLYGFGVGDYAGGNYMRYDPTNGLVLKGGSGNVQLDNNGLVLSSGLGNSNSITWKNSTPSQIGIINFYDSGGPTGISAGIRITSDGVADNGLYTGASNRLGVVVKQVGDGTGYVYAFGNGVTFSGLVVGAIAAPNAMLDVRQATLGSAAFSLSSVATNDDPTETIYQNRVTTTDATQTTIHTYTIPASTTVYMEAKVVARRTGGSGGAAEDGAAYIVTACVKNVGGTATLIGSAATTIVGESQAGFDATITVTSNTALVRVTGALNNNLTWHVTLRVWQVST